MDARVYGVPVTPRTGKPVEVNALWINGLAGLAELTELAGQDAGRAVAAARTGPATSFRRAVPGPGRLAARRGGRARAGVPAGWGRTHDDDLLRPNQLLAWSLPYAPLEPDDRRRCAGSAAGLLTPLGPAQPRPRLAGVRRAGTGAARPSGTAPTTRARSGRGCSARTSTPPGGPSCRSTTLFVGIDGHLSEYGLGSVSETADGVAPHARHRLPVPGVVGGRAAAGPAGTSR